MDITMINSASIEVDGIDTHDYPDFCDAYISYAEYEDGTTLTEEELGELNSLHSDFVHFCATAHFM